MGLVRLLEALRERCAVEVDWEVSFYKSRGWDCGAAEYAARRVREVDVPAWIASQPVLEAEARTESSHALLHGTDRIRVCVAALVTDPLGRALLVRSRRRSGWELPGGKKRAGESWREAVDREVLEETGVALGAGKVLSEVIDAGIAEGLTCDTVIVVARCSAASFDPVAGSDALDARWFDRSALPHLADLPTARLVRAWAGAW